MPDRDDLLARLLHRHGRTFADEVGVDLRRGGADARFRLLVAALLLSARIGADIAVAAARELFAAGCTSARTMCDATWQQRVDALGAGGYRRYDESTATYLGETAALVLDRYDGDLERLRRAAGHDRDRAHALLQECKGIGGVGADIFLREVQAIWPEVRPFADDRVARAADALGLPHSPRGLADAVGDDDLSTLTAALVRADLAGELDAMRAGDELPPSPTQLALATVPELRELARGHDVPGRSRMVRAELVDALRRVG